MNIILTLNPNHSTIAATRKKINSIPAKTRTTGHGPSLAAGTHTLQVLHHGYLVTRGPTLAAALRPPYTRTQRMEIPSRGQRVRNRQRDCWSGTGQTSVLAFLCVTSPFYHLIPLFSHACSSPNHLNYSLFPPLFLSLRIPQ